MNINHNYPNLKIGLLVLLACTFFGAHGFALEKVKIIIKDHKFQPEIVKVPAGVKILLLVENQDETVEEFESFSLNREKIVRGGKTIKVFLPPLSPGEYDFFGEFHMETAKGKVVAE